MSARTGPSVLITEVGEAPGARELGAAIACAGSDPDRAGLMVELSDSDRRPRPALVATVAARALEQRLSAHLPGAAVAARGRVCHLAVGLGPDGLDAVRAAMPLVRDSTCAVVVPAKLTGRVLEVECFDAAVVRAELRRDRPLVALAVRGLMARGLEVLVAKRPLPWAASRLALFGAPAPDAGGALASRLLGRVRPGDADQW